MFPGKCNDWQQFLILKSRLLSIFNICVKMVKNTQNLYNVVYFLQLYKFKEFFQLFIIEWK